MAVSDRVDLAHEPAFVLGRLTVSPSRRELVRDDGQREVLEHRIMQVLIALTKANGEIVSRDELIMSCWDGRVVGEDSINRVIYRLRKVAEGIGEGSFEIETIPRIGYRLTGDSQRPDDRPAPAVARGSASNEEPAVRPTRRNLLLGAAGAAVLAAGGTLLYRRLQGPRLPPEVVQLMQQARQLRDQNTFEGINQAIGLYRRVVEIAPDYADGWGMLGAAYGLRSHFNPRAEGKSLHEHAQAAARRALTLDPGNGYGELALGLALPFIGAWMERDRHLARAFADKPEDADVLHYRAGALQSVGRMAESVELYQRVKERPLTPALYSSYFLGLWSTGRIEEAEQLLDAAASLYPTQTNLWFGRVHMLMYGGRTEAAIAFMGNEEGRPTTTPDEQIEELLGVARALQSRDSREVDAVMAARLERARTYGHGAITAIRDACAFGRLDEAFGVADAYYFSRGFAVPDYPTPESGVSLDQRMTRFLFEPVTRPMRADPRFRRLVDELGLARFWRESGVPPDYLRA